jgi:alkanesulfonate monooxygenase SsuD/methylene tetrahydromethanopterin reductase-like flavin-dependent oxidoreductase (luciferase family)
VTLPSAARRPGSFLGLEINLRGEHDPAHRQHIAQLAGRLGFASVWLPVVSGPPPMEEVRALIAAARPAQLGVAIDVTATEFRASWLKWIDVTRDDIGTGPLLLDLPPAASANLKAAIVGAVGGPAAYQRRVLTRRVADGHPVTPDLDAAGQVVVGVDRAVVAARVAEIREARAAAGKGPAEFTIVVDLAVAIGRTMREAEVRAERDPLLAGERHPQGAGLFGTLEHAQEQVLAYARAGADRLRATLADEHDVADLLAQFRSLAVGPLPVLLTRTD